MKKDHNQAIFPNKMSKEMIFRMNKWEDSMKIELDIIWVLPTFTNIIDPSLFHLFNHWDHC